MIPGIDGGFVPWDVDLIGEYISQLVSSYGNIITIGLVGFLLVTGVYLIIKIAGSFIG